jgi:hypothetical protein
VGSSSPRVLAITTSVVAVLATLAVVVMLGFLMVSEPLFIPSLAQ